MASVETNGTPISTTSDESGEVLMRTKDIETGSKKAERKSAMQGVQTMLSCSSIFTFISNELPALYAHLSNDNLVQVKTFVSDALNSYSGNEASKLGEFLFRNTLSVAAKLLLPVLETAINEPSYNDIQKLQLQGEMERLKKQKDIDGLIQAWKDKRAAGSGIGVVDGKVVYGPRREEEEMPFELSPSLAVGKGGLDAMQRVHRREEEMKAAEASASNDF